MSLTVESLFQSFAYFRQNNAIVLILLPAGMSLAPGNLP
jgi:hypothetical protein